jgi:hypothetical protein
MARPILMTLSANDAEADPAVHSDVALVSAAVEAMSLIEDGDPTASEDSSVGTDEAFLIVASGSKTFYDIFPRWLATKTDTAAVRRNAVLNAPLLTGPSECFGISG